MIVSPPISREAFSHLIKSSLKPDWDMTITRVFEKLKLEFSSKDKAIEYAKKNKIKFELIEPQERKIVKKSYADNFTK